MSDSEIEKITIPSPDAVKARVFPPADGERPVSATPESELSSSRAAQHFAAVEGPRPVAGETGTSTVISRPATPPGAEPFAGADGPRPVSNHPEPKDASSKGQNLTPEK
jgi:hypothetical protein